MPSNLTSPRAGEPLRASWAGDLTRRVNELGGMSPANGLVRDGALGYGVQPLPQNRRERRAATMASAFELGPDGYLKHCYYLYAGILCHLDDQTENAGGINVLQSPGFTVLVIEYSTVNSDGAQATISSYPTINDLKEAQRAETAGIIPLYYNSAEPEDIVGDDGEPHNVPLSSIVDLRTMPMFQGVEILTDGTSGGGDDD